MDMLTTLTKIKRSFLPLPNGMDARIKGNILKLGTLSFVFTPSTKEETIAYVYETFTQQDYKMLDVNGKTVIDIGSAIGDTALYFLSKGAKRVIGYELDDILHQESIRNIALNGKEIKVIMLRRKGSIRDAISRLHNKEKAVLKVDCEGCEYKLMTIKTRKLLKRFDEIILEYHSGYTQLYSILASAGFSCTVMPKHGRIGILHAKKIGIRSNITSRARKVD